MLYTISYILYGRMMRTVQKLASLFLLLLLLLSVIYDDVGMYNETDWYVDDDDVGLWLPSFFPQG